MRNSRGFILVAALSVGLGLAHGRDARADEPAPPPPAATAAAPAQVAPQPAAPAATSTAAASPPAPAAPRGVVVIAIGDDAAVAARALAREAYADETLSPRIDDATARALAGEAVAATAPAKLVEIAEVRKAATSAGNDAVTRRLFASLGADLGAVLVVPVTMRDGRPSARVLSVAKGAFEPIELSGSIEPQADGSTRVKWSGVTSILGGFMPKSRVPAPTAPAPAKPTGAAAPTTPAQGPLAAKKEAPPSSMWSSPWLWAGLSVVAVAGGVVFAVSQTQGGDAGTLRLQGRVSP